MSSREFPPPPLIAPMPWKTGPGRAPLMVTTARSGAAGNAPAATVVPDAAASAAATATTTLAVRLHTVTLTIYRKRRPPRVSHAGRVPVTEKVIPAARPGRYSSRSGETSVATSVVVICPSSRRNSGPVRVPTRRQAVDPRLPHLVQAVGGLLAHRVSVTVPLALSPALSPARRRAGDGHRDVPVGQERGQPRAEMGGADAERRASSTCVIGPWSEMRKSSQQSRGLTGTLAVREALVDLCPALATEQREQLRAPSPVRSRGWPVWPWGGAVHAVHGPYRVPQRQLLQQEGSGRRPAHRRAPRTGIPCAGPGRTRRCSRPGSPRAGARARPGWLPWTR